MLLATIGSSGDVHPFVGLGIALAERGHRVTVLTSRYFEPLVRRAGLDFFDPQPQSDFRSMLNESRIWHPLRGFRFVIERAVVPALEPYYRAIAERHVPGETVVLASSLAMGARLAQEKLGVPTATVHLSPAVFRSLAAGPRLPYTMLGSGVPRPIKQLQYWLADRFLADRYLAGPLNELRARLGLPPVSRIMHRWWNSPQLVLGLFPDWYASPQADWPPQTRLTGFPLYDEHGVTDELPELETFLATGKPPIIFTPGSANVHGTAFFAAAADACRLLDRPGILLTRFPEQLPATLPAGVRHFDFIPFSRLLPRAAAVVHHGGIGTTAQGLAAGVPQLLMPMAFDQFDNAQRLRRLGVGRALPPQKFTATRVRAELARLLESSAVAQACQAAAERFAAQQPLEELCAQIEGLLTVARPRLVR